MLFYRRLFFFLCSFGSTQVQAQMPQNLALQAWKNLPIEAFQHPLLRDFQSAKTRQNALLRPWTKQQNHFLELHYPCGPSLGGYGLNELRIAHNSMRLRLGCYLQGPNTWLIFFQARAETYLQGFPDTRFSEILGHFVAQYQPEKGLWLKQNAQLPKLRYRDLCTLWDDKEVWFTPLPQGLGIEFPRLDMPQEALQHQGFLHSELPYFRGQFLLP